MITNQKKDFILIILGLFLLILSCTSVKAQIEGEPRKSVHIQQVLNPPTIDGLLDDEMWDQATIVSDLHQTDPIEYAEASEKSEFYVAYDKDALYVAARLYDSQEVRANVLRQGADIQEDDQVFVILDPYNNGRDGYQFQINPNGVRREGLFVGPNQMQWNWSGIWSAAATQTEYGWVAEMAIPFKTLSFDEENDTWGINFGRRAQAKNERMAWVSRNRNQTPAISGRIVGFQGLDQGRGLDVVPSLSLRDSKDFATSSSSRDFEPSVDVFYRITPSLNGSLTINTDFSATEVDDRQVNLSRFGLFFPEKRDFFLQDADAFEFGGIGGLGGFHQLSNVLDQNARPFFSRTVGLSDSGQPVDLDYGGKVSGRIGPWSLGSLAIRQVASGDVDPTNLFVGRASLNVLEESSLGFITTHGDPHSNLENNLAGVDFRYLNTRLPGGKPIEAQAWYQQTKTTGLVGDDAAYGVRFRLPGTSGLRASAGFKEVQSNFNPAMGYLNRAGIRDSSAEIGWFQRYPQTSKVRMIFSYLGWQRVDLIEGGLQSEVINWRVINFHNQAGDNIRLLHTRNREVLNEPFQIWDPGSSSGIKPVSVPIGEYSYSDTALRLQSEQSRKLSTTLVYRRGTFFDGERENIEAQFTWYPTKNFRGFVSYNHNDIELPNGAFSLRLARLGIDTIFSNTLSWANLIQYDNDSESIGINSRLHWIPQAGREAFIVLNHNLQDLNRIDKYRSMLADLNIKLSYTFRF
tara:strand:- start:550 stop:2784 length:2235 start_codon:yes stop_codon:yes gene_type:complete